MDISHVKNSYKQSEVDNLLSKSQEREQEIKEVSNEFASIFMELVVEAMRESIPENGLINGGNAEKIYRSMLDTEYSKMMVEGPGKDLAKSLYNDLMKKQGQEQYGLPQAAAS